MKTRRTDKIELALLYSIFCGAGNSGHNNNNNGQNEIGKHEIAVFLYTVQTRRHEKFHPTRKITLELRIENEKNYAWSSDTPIRRVFLFAAVDPAPFPLLCALVYKIHISIHTCTTYNVHRRRTAYSGCGTMVDAILRHYVCAYNIFFSPTNSISCAPISICSPVGDSVVVVVVHIRFIIIAEWVKPRRR